MAKQVLKAIATTPQQTEQIPSLLVAASFGGEMDSEGSPNAEKGVKDLRRKFEDNEADIITELYARHFKQKNDFLLDSQTQRASPSPNLREGVNKLAPNDSIGEQGFMVDVDDVIVDGDNRRAGERTPVTGAPKPETYSKPL